MLQKKRAFDITERTKANRDHASIGNHPQHLTYVCMYVFIY